MSVLFRGGLLLDGSGRAPVHNPGVLVEGQRIAAVGTAEDFVGRDVATVVDTTGMTIVPGLIDAHVHLFPFPEELGPLFLPWGVTSVRDTGGPIEQLAQWRLATSDGGRRSPRLWFTGTIDQPPIVHDALISVESVEDVPAHVERIRLAGANAVKLYTHVGPDLAAAIIRCAHEHGLSTTAHLHRTRPGEAIDAGIDGLEHTTTAMEELVPRGWMTSDGLQTANPRWHRGFASIDPGSDAARTLADLLSDRGVYVTPTLIAHDYLTRFNDPEVTEAPHLQPVPESLSGFWATMAGGMTGKWDTTDYSVARRGFEVALEYTSLMRTAGVALLVGTDSPVPYLLPGESLHGELELLVSAGMTPAAALEAATGGNAATLQLDDVGTVEPGKLADLVVLGPTVLDDIRLSRDVRMVFRGGEQVAGAIRVSSATASVVDESE